MYLGPGELRTPAQAQLAHQRIDLKCRVLPRRLLVIVEPLPVRACAEPTFHRCGAHVATCILEEVRNAHGITREQSEILREGKVLWSVESVTQMRVSRPVAGRDGASGVAPWIGCDVA